MCQDEESCFECGYRWTPKDYFENEYICPNCGTDVRNPITYYYNKKDRHDIKNNIYGKDWLININLEYFLFEKQNREKTLKMAEKGLKRIVNTAYPPIHSSFLDYCNEHYGFYDISLLDLKYINLEKEIILKFPNLYLNKNERDNIVRYILCVAVKSIAQHQLNELYEAMKLRKDKGTN